MNCVIQHHQSVYALTQNFFTIELVKLTYLIRLAVVGVAHDPHKLSLSRKTVSEVDIFGTLVVAAAVEIQIMEPSIVVNGRIVGVRARATGTMGMLLMLLLADPTIE